VLRHEAERLVDIYLENSDLAAEPDNPYTVGPITVRPAKAKPYQHSIHPEYDLNGLEEEVAEAIDATGLDWCRNPSNGGFSIPLLDKGDTRRFFPDFLVWKDTSVFAIDPKGKMLLMSEAGRKLLSIYQDGGGPSLLVRLITAGRWSDSLKQIGAKGFTVWDMTRAGKIRGRHRATVRDAVNLAIQ
jgi:type III restriction enzyme